jgi:hypothetical protein
MLGLFTDKQLMDELVKRVNTRLDESVHHTDDLRIRDLLYEAGHWITKSNARLKAPINQNRGKSTPLEPTGEVR